MDLDLIYIPDNDYHMENTRAQYCKTCTLFSISMFEML